MTRLRSEKMHYPFHYLPAGVVTKVFKVGIGLNGYDAKAVSGRSKSQFQES